MPEQDKYFDPLRRKWVAATPEEKVRQWFIAFLRDTAEVPLWLMNSEVQMKYAHKVWRADILIYSKQGTPLAVVECKRPDVKIDAEAATQALRYHSVQNVSYIFLTNGETTYAYERSGSGFSPMDHIPNYTEMLDQCQQ